ncbi:MAG: DUF3794 domain-containing protein [Clostridia bacterium]|nr:DUF3794 domain-containing protein [Clostridia bacterium]
MSINLIKEEVRTTEVVCQKYSQSMVECDVIVPDVKPDIRRVLEVSGTVSLTQKLLQQDKILLQGVVRMTVLYLPDDGGYIKSLNAMQEFTHAIDCRGILPEMQLLAEAESENFDSTLINSRKLNLRCILGIGVKVTRPVLLEIAGDVADAPSVVLKQQPLRILSGADHTECQIILREQLELPSGKPTIGEILKITAAPTGIELCMMNDKAVAKGQVKICTLYLDESETPTLQFMEHAIPFTEILDADGIREEMNGEVEYTLNDMYYEIREDSDGEARNLGLELVLGALLRCNETREVPAIVDAYSLNGDISIQTKPHHLEQLLDQRTAELTIKDTAKLPSMLPGLKQICDVNATAKIDRISAENGQITVFGTVHTRILYLSSDETAPISAFSHVSEFSHTFDIEGADTNTVCDARVMTEHVSYTIAGENSLDLRFILGLSLKALQTGSVPLIDELCEVPMESSAFPAMLLYFVQEGDSLWSIAKRYHTTIDTVNALNHLESDTIYPGQQLKLLAQNTAT